MDKRDYLYWALMAVAAFVFYCRGVRAGFRRATLMAQKIFNYRQRFSELPPPECKSAKPYQTLVCGKRIVLSKSTTTGVFGHN